MSGPSPPAILGLLRSQLLFHPTIPTSSFSGQVVIITGANAGLGLEVLKHVVRLGARKVILGVRNLAKGEIARGIVGKETGRTDCMEVWPLDMADFESVKTFAKRAQKLARLDVLVANAGMWSTTFEKAEGWDMTITVNVISTFLLIRLLLPMMQNTAAREATTPRITIVTSTLHKFATLRARKANKVFDELRKETKDLDGRYYDSKLLVMLYSGKLASKTQPQVCLNTVCPGYCISGLKGSDGAGSGLAERVMARSSDEGARCIVDAVAAEEAGGRHGAYLSDLKVKRPAAWIESKDGQQTTERVWNELNAILDDLGEHPVSARHEPAV